MGMKKEEVITRHFLLFSDHICSFSEKGEDSTMKRRGFCRDLSSFALAKEIMGKIFRKCPR
jgi:hypothetical protein